MTARLTPQGVPKRFGETLANDVISLKVMPSEILAVLGGNGTGTSTLMKIVYGVERPDARRVACIAFPGSARYVVPRSSEVADDSFDVASCPRTPGHCADWLLGHADRF